MFWKKKKDPNLKRIALIGMVLSMVCANSTPIFSKLLTQDGWTPVSLYFLTLLVMTIFLGMHEFMMIESGEKWGMTKEDVRGMLLTTVTGGVLSPLLFFVGLSYVMASESVLITSMLPLFIVLFARVFLKEKFSHATVVGGLFLCGGLVVLLLPDIRSAQLSLGVPMLIGSCVFGALTTIIHKRYVKHRHLDSIVLVRTVLSLICISLWMAFTEPESFELILLPQRAWLIFALPVIGFIMPFFLYFRALAHVTAMEAGLVAGTGPVFGVILSALLLGESISPYQIFSLLLIVFGILYINVPLTKWRIVPSRLANIGPLRK